MQSAQLISTADEVTAGNRGLVRQVGVDELKITTRVHGPDLRLCSFGSIAKAFDLP